MKQSPSKNIQFVSSTVLKKIYPPRPASARKYNYGSLLIIGGNFMYTGAPVLAALGALRAGADVVTLAAPARAANAAAANAPLITYPLDGDFLMKKHVGEILRLTDKKDALVIGPGLGREEETLKTVRAIVEAVEIPVVVDADGIFAFAQVQKSKVKNQSYGSKLKTNLIFTPHMGEFKILCGQKNIKDDMEAKIKIAQETARKLRAIILLKGQIDIITDGVEIMLNKTGSPYMTSGGTGDVLAGITGSIAAQLHARGEHDYFKAAACAAYISGRAGEMAAKKYADSLIATDVIEHLKDVIGKRTPPILKVACMVY